MPRFRFTEIVWDTDGVKVELPDEDTIEGEDMEHAADGLSEKHGWCFVAAQVEELS